MSQFYKNKNHPIYELFLMLTSVRAKHICFLLIFKFFNTGVFIIFSQFFIIKTLIFRVQHKLTGAQQAIAHPVFWQTTIMDGKSCSCHFLDSHLLACTKFQFTFFITQIFFVKNQLNISKFLPPQRRKTLHSY